MAALSTIVVPVQEEHKFNEVMLRHEIVVTSEPLKEKPPANCCTIN